MDKLRGKWCNKEEAMTWPEGSVVVIHRLDRHEKHYRAFELCIHFRPDWVDRSMGYGMESMEFMRLT